MSHLAFSVRRPTARKALGYCAYVIHIEEGLKHLGYRVVKSAPSSAAAPPSFAAFCKARSPVPQKHNVLVRDRFFRMHLIKEHSCPKKSSLPPTRIELVIFAFQFLKVILHYKCDAVPLRHRGTQTSGP